MKMTLAAAAAFVLVSVPAMAQDHSAHGDHAKEGNPAVVAFTEVNDKMHGEMAIEYSGNVDVDFVQGMIPHHQGAVDMARIVLEHGEDPEIRAFAEEIIAAQEGEIAWMRGWLAENGQ